VFVAVFVAVHRARAAAEVANGIDRALTGWLTSAYAEARSDVRTLLALPPCVLRDAAEKPPFQRLSASFWSVVECRLVPLERLDCSRRSETIYCNLQIQRFCTIRNRSRKIAEQFTCGVCGTQP
jgi:hypothetical protein